MEGDGHVQVLREVLEYQRSGRSGAGMSVMAAWRFVRWGIWMPGYGGAGTGCLQASTDVLFAQVSQDW